MLQLANGKQQFLDQNGAPLAGGLVYHYAPGTTNPVTTYKDSAGQAANKNPIELDSRGQAIIWGTGMFRQVVADSSGVTIWDQIVNAPDVNAPASSLAALLLAKTGSALVGFQQAGAGAVSRLLRDKQREIISATDFGATGDGQTDDSAAFSRAAAYAGSIHADIMVPPPATSYLLSSDPVVPDNVNFRASPDWFTGAGRMPFHKFTAISEGVDPRVFSIKSLNYTQTETNESKRKWGVVGWVYYGNSPSAAATGTNSDAVGVDGRGVCDAFNGRVWGLLGLAHMTPEAFNGTDPGVSQAYACELDINNNSGHDVQGFDQGPITRGLCVVSGGSNRPAEALYVLATKTPTNGSGDNRWLCGLRFYQDSVKSYAIHVDDGVAAKFARIPSTCAGIQWTHQELINFAEYQDQTSKRRVMWSQTAGYGYDWVNSAGQGILSTNDGNVQAHKPLLLNTIVEGAPDTLDVSEGNLFILNSPGTINHISGGQNGQEITIVTSAAVTITMVEGSNVRMATPSFAMGEGSTIRFVFADPTWFEVSRSVNT